MADLVSVNLGKWILRFLFDRLIQEEVQRDATFREKLMADTSKPGSLRRENAPTSIQLPNIHPHDHQDLLNEDDFVITPRPDTNGLIRPATTPGLTIGAATPHANGASLYPQPERPEAAEEGTILEKRTSQHSHPRSSTERKNDYFAPSAQARSPIDGQGTKSPNTPGDISLEGTSLISAQTALDVDKEEKAKEGGIFGKGFRMKFPKKLARPSTDVKPVVVDEKSEESDKSEKEDRTIQDNLYGTIQRMRFEHEERIVMQPSEYLQTSITPSLLNETPKLQLPPFTTVIIQDERPDSGGVADLYRGTISSVGLDADLIENVAPTWLGDLLLRVSQIHMSCHLAC